jgi:hypothetical protein
MGRSDAPGVPGVGVAAWSAGSDGYPDEGNLAVLDQIDPSAPTGNMLLDALGLDERVAVLSDARRRPITVGDVLLWPGDPTVYVPFPTAGTLSMVAQPEDVAVEAATIGREGAAGIHSAPAPASRANSW